MPKRRAPKYDTKPSSPAHPSLSSSNTLNTSRSLSSSSSPTGNSVNDQIQQLRLTQRPSPSSLEGRAAQNVYSPTFNPSLPPSLRNILQLPNAPPPRPRIGSRVTGGRRGPAGPAAPQSWLGGVGKRVSEQKAGDPAAKGGDVIRIECLPDAYQPDDGSLLASMLKALAKNWEWHKSYDQYYLATILVRHKEALLHYIAQYSEHGIDKAGLEILFQDDSELEDATGAEGLTHLDLAASIGHHLKLTDLRGLLSTKESASSLIENPDSAPESWDDLETPNHGLSSPGRFDSLTHLSLAHPKMNATWKALLDLAPNLSTLTHLSLSHWPIPTLSPNSKTAYTETPQGNVNYGASNFYSVHDQDWTEAASIIRRLGRSTYCLQWLDLTGCEPWTKALGTPDIDWWGSWRALKTIKIGPGWIPDCFQDGAGERSWREILDVQDDGGRRNKEGRQLLEWAYTEFIGLQLEITVNWRIGGGSAMSRPVHLGEDQLQPWQPDDIQRTSAKHPESPKSQETRTSRVRFDRDWDASWIREAIEEITKKFMLQTLVHHY